jgi:hypothetical protein
MLFPLNIIISAEINSAYFPILFFDKLQTSHRDTISSILFKSKLLCLIAIIRGFQILQLHQLKPYMHKRDKTIHIYMCSCIVLYSSELNGKGSLCDEERKILGSASINKPNDRIHNEIS